ncbi:MAG: hypothetical protein E3J72_11025 [Planctomycetota bacterium]|nr:MAG: hypothetical protein E3J72_11025 [Planctomycetota bacterium]
MVTITKIRGAVSNRLIIGIGVASVLVLLAASLACFLWFRIFRAPAPERIEQVWAESFEGLPLTKSGLHTRSYVGVSDKTASAGRKSMLIFRYLFAKQLNAEQPFIIEYDVQFGKRYPFHAGQFRAQVAITPSNNSSLDLPLLSFRFPDEVMIFGTLAGNMKLKENRWYGVKLTYRESGGRCKVSVVIDDKVRIEGEKAIETWHGGWNDPCIRFRDWGMCYIDNIRLSRIVK